MQLPKPSALGMFQLMAACVLVALLTCPSDAHLGPMLILKGGGHHGGGGFGGAAGVLAAGLALKLISEMHKGHGGGGGGFSHGGGHGFGGGQGMMHSFASHDAHLGSYGYMPQDHGAWMR